MSYLNKTFSDEHVECCSTLATTSDASLCMSVKHQVDSRAVTRRLKDNFGNRKRRRIECINRRELEA
jgi:hypothetical protein